MGFGAIKKATLCWLVMLSLLFVNNGANLQTTRRRKTKPQRPVAKTTIPENTVKISANQPSTVIGNSDNRVSQVITRAEDHFRKGKLNLEDRNREAARDEFDKAVDSILESGFDVRSNQRLQTYYLELVERIYLEEVPFTGSFQGVVVTKYSSKPIEGVSVKFINDLTKSEFVTETDSKGHFSQKGLPPGVYRIQFSAKEYESREIVQRLIVGAYQATEVVPLPVELEIKGINSRVDTTFRPPLGSIAVASTKNATIVVKAVEGNATFSNTIPANELLSVFDDLPARTYRVSASLEGYQSAEKEVTVFANKTSPVSLQLLPNKVSTQIITTAGPYYALIVGNNKYSHFPNLETAEADAKTIDDILKETYGFKTRLLLNADRSQILAALNWFRRKAEPSSNLLIYYAGHGFYDEEVDKAYWLPVDAETSDNANWISADDITVNVKGTFAQHVLIISDSCYSGAILRATWLRTSDTPDRDRYLEKMSKGRSRTLMSSGGNEPVTDGGGAGHSVFASALVTGLREMDKEIFTAGELYYNFIREVVSGKSYQTPEYSPLQNSGHENGDFVFIHKQLFHQAK